MLMTIEVDMQQKHKIGNAVCYGLFGSFYLFVRFTKAMKFHFLFIFNHFLVTCFLSITTTMLTAYQYGMSTTPNVLEILPKSNLLYCAIMLVTLQLCLSNAVGSSALFQNFEEYLHIPKGIKLFTFRHS